MNQIIVYLLIIIGIVNCENNSQKEPYWRDIKYGKKGYSFHGLKFGGVYTDEDFKFSDDSSKDANSIQQAGKDDTNILSSPSFFIKEIPTIVNVKPVYEANVTDNNTNDFNLRGHTYMVTEENDLELTKAANIIEPPNLVAESNGEEKKQEVKFVENIKQKEVKPQRGDECIECTTNPLYVRDATHLDDIQYTSQRYYVTETDLDDTQYTSKPSYETETDKDDSQYTTIPSYRPETTHTDDSQYTTKPSYQPETTHTDDSQYTTILSYQPETTHTDDSQYTNKPSYQPQTIHTDDSQYTTKPSYQPETTHTDESQYTTKPSYQPETTHIDDSQYTTKPSYQPETTHTDESQYTTKPSYQPETTHIDDSQYTTKPSYQPETTHTDDSQYTTKPSYLSEATHTDDNQYTTRPSYLPEATHTDDNQYTTKPSYQPETTHTDDSQYTTKPSYQPETTHTDDSQYTTRPSYQPETTHMDDSQYTTKPSYQPETTHMDDSLYTTKPSYRPETTHTDDSQYTTKPSNLPEATHTDDSHYTTKPSYLPETTHTDHSQYTTKPSYHSRTHKTPREKTTSWDEWIWETTPKTTTKMPVVVPVYPVYHEWNVPSVFVHSVEHGRPTFKGFDFVIHHGPNGESHYEHHVPGSSINHPFFNRFSTHDPSHHATFSTEPSGVKVKGKIPTLPTIKTPVYHTTHISTSTRDFEPTTPRFPETTNHVPFTSIIHEPTTNKPSLETTFISFPTYSGVKGHPHHRFLTHSPFTTSKPTTLKDKYPQHTSYFTTEKETTSNEPITRETTYYFEPSTDKGVKGHRVIPTTYTQNTHEYTTLYETTIPIFTTAKISGIKGHDVSVTSHPEEKTYSTIHFNHTTSTSKPTKATGVIGHRHHFFVTSTTDYPSTTPRVKGHKFNAVYSQTENNRILRQNFGMKRHRLPASDGSDPTSGLSDKNTRLNVGSHFYFPDHNVVKRNKFSDTNQISADAVIKSANSTNVRDRLLPLSLNNNENNEKYTLVEIKGKKKPQILFKQTEPESIRDYQEEIKGHSSYDINRSEIKGRSGDMWKKYFVDDFIPGKWKNE